MASTRATKDPNGISALIVVDKDNTNETMQIYGIPSIGALHVAVVDGSGTQITSFGGSGGTSAADDADFTDGTTEGTPAMGVYEATPTTVTDGDLGVVGITEDRQLKVLASLSATDNAVLDNIDADLTTLIGHVDGLEALLTTIDADTSDIHSNSDAMVTDLAAIEVLLGTIDADTGGILTAIQILDNIVSGSEAQVDVVAALPAGTNNIGDVDIASIAAGDNNIGNVDIVTLPGDVEADIDQIRDQIDLITPDIEEIRSDVDAIRIAVETLDNVVSGSEAQVDVVGALPAGTNALGKLLPPDIDVTTHTNYAKKYYTNAGAVTDGIIWSPAAGKRWHVAALFINVSAACTVTLEDDLAAGDSAVLKMELAANSGLMIPFPEKYPLASGEDAADLLITTTAGNVYVTAVGYEI